jgi:hypothetical protein
MAGLLFALPTTQLTAPLAARGAFMKISTLRRRASGISVRPV